MSSIGWTPEFCTVCYKQCHHGDVYCSQGCRDVDSLGQAPDFVHDSEFSGSAHHSCDHDAVTDSSEYDEEEDEMPQLWLTKTRSNDVAPLRSTGKSQPRRRENGHFLYESPMLKPTSALTNDSSHHTTSPPLSPLLIPTTRPATPEMHMSVQSVNTYKRWLADSAI